MSQSSSAAVQRAQDRRSTRKAMRHFRIGGPSYSKLVHAYFQSEQYAKLSPRAVKLLVDLMAQYRGTNNGDLTTAWSVMQRSGWRSKDLLKRATDELRERGWITKTRQGSINAATLWALTFYGIDDCRASDGSRKLDAGVKADSMPLHLWRLPDHDKPAAVSKRRFKTKAPAREPGKPFPIAGKAEAVQGSKVTELGPYLSRVPGQ